MTDKKALIALWVTLILWGSAFVGIQEGLKYFTPGALALLRYSIGSVAILPLYFNLSSRTKITRKELPWLFLLGIIGFSLYNVLLNIGETMVSGAIASFIASQIPVVTILLATVFLRERLTKLAWGGLCVSSLGIVLIAFGESKQMGHFNIGILFVIASVCCGGLYSVLQKPLLKRMQAIELTAWAMWLGTLSLMGFAPTVIHQVMAQHSLWHFFWPVFLGVGPGVIGFACWSYGLKHFPATKAASFLFAMPIIATLMGWLLLSDIPTWISLAGGLVALSGAFIVRAKK